MTFPERTDAQRFLAPAAYVQGEKTLETFSKHTRTIREAETAYVLGGTTALNETEAALITELKTIGVSVTVEAGVDECTVDSIDNYAQRADELGADIVVGVGGGKALDVAKAVSEKAACDVITVPTVASTDAPCSAVSIVYDADGSVEPPRFHSRNPTLVLVDTEVLAGAPERFLRYGIGDALATKFESEAASRANGTTDAGGSSSYAAGALAATVYERLREDGGNALAAAAEGTVTPAFERVVETVILRSGIGFESGGVAGAHAFHNGAVKHGSKCSHGELVCFGTVFELALERRTATLETVVELCAELGLGIVLNDIGVTDVTALARSVAESPLMENEPVAVTPNAVTDAILEADERLRKITNQ